MFDLLDALGLDYKRLPAWLIRLSYRTASLTGYRGSWCAMAHERDWRLVTWLLGRKHCRECWLFWRN